jgi:hypothetical protein
MPLVHSALNCANSHSLRKFTPTQYFYLGQLHHPRDGTVFYSPVLSLHNLCALRRSWSQSPPFWHSNKGIYDGPCFTIDDLDLDCHLQMIDANQDTLRELHIIGLHVDKLPVRIFDSLTHLEIYILEGEISGLPFVFHHAVRLESLVLAGWRWEPFLPFDTNPDILPRLSSFYISAFPLRSSRIWENVCNLIGRRGLLQRLSLKLPSDWSQILIIKDLPALRVLGLNAGHQDALTVIALYLPPKLESLYLELVWNDDISLEPLVLNQRTLRQMTLLTDFVYQRGALESLPNLTYLHLFDTFDDLTITAQELAHDMKHLRIVGCQRCLWDIVRVGDNEMVLPWNCSKKEWRDEEDFPNEDIAWLLKYS